MHETGDSPAEEHPSPPRALKTRWVKVETRKPNAIVVRPSKPDQARRELRSIVDRYNLKYHKHQPEDPFSELERCFEQLQLNDDDKFGDILDRAERRDIPASVKLRSMSNSDSIRSPSAALDDQWSSKFSSELRTSQYRASPTDAHQKQNEKVTILPLQTSANANSLEGSSSSNSATNSTGDLSMSASSSTSNSTTGRHIPSSLYRPRSRSKMPNSIEDDVVFRKLSQYKRETPQTSAMLYHHREQSEHPHHRDHHNNNICAASSASVGIMSYMNLVTYDSCIEGACRPHPLALCVYCSGTLLHTPSDGCPGNNFKKSPNLIVDDVLYRRIRQSQAAKVPLEPHPQFGIPNSPYVAQLHSAASTDYSRLEPETMPRRYRLRERQPNLVNDDLAFRSLRRDVYENRINSTPLPPTPSPLPALRPSTLPISYQQEYRDMHRRNENLKKFSFTEYSSLESCSSTSLPESNWSETSILI